MAVIVMDEVRQMIIKQFLSADADAVIGAEWSKPSTGRTAKLGAYRHRDLDTHVGTIEVAVPTRRTEPTFPNSSSSGANEPNPR